MHGYHLYRFVPYHHYHRGASMFGRLFFFLIGAYAGAIANQRYRIPDMPTPNEAWEKAKKKCEDYERNEEDKRRKRRSAPSGDEESHESEQGHHGRRRHGWGQTRFQEHPQLREILDRLKELEKIYRKDQTNASTGQMPTQPPTHEAQPQHPPPPAPSSSSMF